MTEEYCILEPGRNYATEFEKTTLKAALNTWKGVETEGYRLVRVGNYPFGQVLRKRVESTFSYGYAYEKTPDVYDTAFPIVEVLKVRT